MRRRRSEEASRCILPSWKWSSWYKWNDDNFFMYFCTFIMTGDEMRIMMKGEIEMPFFAITHDCWEVKRKLMIWNLDWFLFSMKTKLGPISAMLLGMICHTIWCYVVYWHDVEKNLLKCMLYKKNLGPDLSETWLTFFNLVTYIYKVAHLWFSFVVIVAIWFWSD